MCEARARGPSGPSRGAATTPRACGRTPAPHSNSVVLPAPLGPISPSTSPSRIVSETHDSAVNRPYVFVRRSTLKDTRGGLMAQRKSIGGDQLLPVVVNPPSPLRAVRGFG